MTRINFDVEDITGFKFKQIVGKGNISKTLRDFIDKIVYDNYDEQQLEQKNKNISSDIFEMQLEQKSIEFQLNKIKEQKEKEKQIIKQDLINQQNEKNNKYSFDPFAHLTGQTKLNASQILLYRVEKNKTLPKWAKDREPNKPKEFAIELLKRLNKKIKGER